MSISVYGAGEGILIEYSKLMSRSDATWKPYESKVIIYFNTSCETQISIIPGSLFQLDTLDVSDDAGLGFGGGGSSILRGIYIGGFNLLDLDTKEIKTLAVKQQLKLDAFDSRRRCAYSVTVPIRIERPCHFSLHVTGLVLQ